MLFLSFASNSFGELVVTEADLAQKPSAAKEAANRIVWIAGALPPGARTEGKWLWDEALRDGDAASHGDGGAGRIKVHSFRAPSGVELERDSVVMQDVFLDPHNTPSGIMVKLLLAEGGEISLYWEGEEEAFVDLDEYIRAWYMGPLPKPGGWRGLRIGLREFDIEAARINGISFITSGGNIWWGKTIILKNKE